MKAFYEWLEQNNIPTNSEDLVTRASRESWRAALKRVLDKYKELDMEDWDVVACKIKKWIEQELEVSNGKT